MGLSCPCAAVLEGSFVYILGLVLFDLSTEAVKRTSDSLSPPVLLWLVTRTWIMATWSLVTGDISNISLLTRGDAFDLLLSYLYAVTFQSCLCRR
ncbi:hypothetical protein CPC08DRAFT_391554 [Agrocybe pediades]|nr:hypothetical protein CPC08DRAFT_391554 [Agrocybe pediades]